MDKELSTSAIAAHDISFVIQGELKSEITPQTIASIRQFFPNAEIVLSTYIGTDVSDLVFDKIVFVKDPGFYYLNNQQNSPKNNINRQIQTTLAGLKAAKGKYAFKLRSDFIVTGSDFLDFFYKFPQTESGYQIFEHKLLSCVFFSRDPRRRKSYPFHPSDVAFFGLRTDLINLFDISFMDERDTCFYEENNALFCKYAPEQHIWLNCLWKNGKNVNVQHRKDINEQIIIDSEKYAVSNFIYLDWEQFDLLPPEHLRQFSNNDFRNVITHIEWQKLYKKYLDFEHVAPDKDNVRDLIEKNTLF